MQCTIWSFTMRGGLFLREGLHRLADEYAREKRGAGSPP